MQEYNNGLLPINSYFVVVECSKQKRFVVRGTDYCAIVCDCYVRDVRLKSFPTVCVCVEYASFDNVSTFLVRYFELRSLS